MLHFVRLSWTSVVVLAATACFVQCPPAQAEVIVWQTPVAIGTADATLSQPGSVVSAACFGPSAIAVTLSDGQTITFGAGTTIDPDTGEVHLPGSAIVATGAGPQEGTFFGGDTGNASFNAVLNTSVADGLNPREITLKNLIAGAQYSVQLFAADSRNDIVRVREVCFSDKADQSGSNSATMVLGDQKYVIGTFTAAGSEVTLYQPMLKWEASFGGGYYGNLNAVVVRMLSEPPQTVPEPGTLALLGAGILLLVTGANYKRKQSDCPAVC